MRRYVSLLVVAIMVLSMTVGCAGGKTTNQSPAPDAAKPSEQSKQEVPADNFPQKPINWIIAAAPGNPADTVARILAPAIQNQLPNKQPIVIVNKAGAAGIPALGELLNAEQDGYTWCSTGFANIILTPHSKESPFKHDSFQPVVNVFVQPQVFVVPANAPYNTFKEWQEYASKNPGKFRYGVSGTGTIPHITGLSISAELKLDTTPVIYKSDAEAVTALLGNHIEGSYLSFSGAISSIESKKLKALAYTTDIKSDELPNVPNLKELGLTFKAMTFNGVLTSKNIPKNRLAMISEAFKKALEDPKVKEQLKNANLPANAVWGPDEFSKVINDTYISYEALLNKLGLMQELYPK